MVPVLMLVLIWDELLMELPTGRVQSDTATNNSENKIINEISSLMFQNYCL